MRSAFENNFRENDEVGASLCISVHGRTVVDLWGGHTSRAARRPWGPETLVNAFSVGKGVTAVLAAMCVADGAFGYYDPVVRHWPEFAAHGKDTLTVRDLLGHRGGLPAVREPLHDGAMFEWSTMTDALAAERPWWFPGSGHGYHVNTFGFLAGEVIRRATGSGPGRMLRERVRDVLGADLHFGVPEDLHGTIADLEWDNASVAPTDLSVLDEAQLMQNNAYRNPAGLSGVGVVNTARWRSGEMPSTNLHASARGVHALFRGLLDGLVPSEVLADAMTEVSNGHDLVLGRTTRFSAGFQLPLPERNFGPNSSAFGHFGAGGATGFCDPTAGVAFGYVMNRPGAGWQNPRNTSLIAALFGCL